MSTKIYTKTGDSGSTGLLNGTRVSKHHIRIECFGMLDELNSHVGLTLAHLQHEDFKGIDALKQVQNELFVIGSHLALDPDKPVKFTLPEFDLKTTLLLENTIDEMEEVLPPLKAFILPGGGVATAQVHIARTVCRRAERNLVGLSEISEINPEFIVFLNRLSDFLFVFARFVAFTKGEAEVLWNPKNK